MLLVNIFEPIQRWVTSSHLAQLCWREMGGCIHSRESVYEQKSTKNKAEVEINVQHLPAIHGGPVLALSRTAPGATQFISGSEDKVRMKIRNS
jgi:hypothetical protein